MANKALHRTAASAFWFSAAVGKLIVRAVPESPSRTSRQIPIMHMKIKKGIFLMWLATTALFFQGDPHANAQAQVPDVKSTNSAPQKNDTKPTSTKGQSTVVRDRVPGSFLSPDSALRRISGRVKVLNAHTLCFDD